MRALRIFASVLLAISVAFGSVCAWFVIVAERTVWPDARGVLLGPFDPTDWLSLAAWSAVGFFVASLGGIVSALGLFVFARWSRVMLLSSLLLAAVIAMVDWIYAGTPGEILDVAAVVLVAAFSWWLLDRHQLRDV